MRMGIYKRAELTECELTTMKIVWDAKEPITCSEIIEILEKKYDLKYKDTTVYTFLKNLKDKGFIESYRKGITLFVPARSEEEYRADVLKKENKFWFEGSTSSFYAALAENDGMSEEDMEKILAIAKKYEK